MHMFGWYLRKGRGSVCESLCATMHPKKGCELYIFSTYSRLGSTTYRWFCSRSDSETCFSDERRGFTSSYKTKEPGPSCVTISTMFRIITRYSGPFGRS